MVLSSASVGLNASFTHAVNFLKTLGVPENNSVQVRMGQLNGPQTDSPAGYDAFVSSADW